MLIVNLYVVYRKVLTQAGLQQVSHYKYQEAITLGLVGPENYGNWKSGYNTPPPDGDSTLSTLSSSTNSSSGSKRKRVSDYSLDPIQGSIRCRLNKSLDHWPSTATQDKHGHKPPCQLHRWACGRTCQKYTNIVYCQECDVNLCTDECYRLFHTKWDLKAEKERICDKYAREQQQNETDKNKK